MVVAEPASHVWLWGLELTGSAPIGRRETKQTGSHPTDLPKGGGLDVNAGAGHKFIDLVIHDNVGNGIGWWAGSDGGEVHGCLIYRNGWKAPDRTHGHCIYTQNRGDVKTISNCILSVAPEVGSYSVHAYGSSRAYVDNYLIEDNIVDGHGPFLVGGGRPSHGIRVRRNYLHGVGMRIGYGAENEDCEVRDNVLAGGALTIEKYRTVVDRDNVRGLPARLAVLTPDRYDPDRAHLVVFNGAKAENVAVDVASFLKPGDAYRLMDPRGRLRGPPRRGNLRRATGHGPHEGGVRRVCRTQGLEMSRGLPYRAGVFGSSIEKGSNDSLPPPPDVARGPERRSSMPRIIARLLTLGLTLSGGLALAQEGVQRGTLKATDADGGTVTIAVLGKDQVFRVTRDTRVVGADGRRVGKPFDGQTLAAGTAVAFKAGGGDPPALVGLRVLGGGGPTGPDGEIRRATVKKLDPEKKTITLTVGGKDEDYLLTDDTQVLGATGNDLSERMQGFKEGSEVQFKAGKRDGKAVVLGLRLFPAGGRPVPARPGVDTSKLNPLTAMGGETYQGFEGGLYPGGKSERPEGHEAAGLALAGQVVPLDEAGKPARDGKVVLLSVGMSNTTQEFSAFQRLAAADPDKSPSLVIVDGAQGGMTAARIKDPDDNASGTTYWRVVDQRLKAAGATREQVQVAWIKQADAGPTRGFPKYARDLRDELRQVVRVMRRRFPNLKLVYLSSRTYGGYAKTPLNPEPYAYESGFSVKWLIEEQLKGDPR